MNTTKKIAVEAALVLLVGAGLAIGAGVAGAATPTVGQQSPPVGDVSPPVGDVSPPVPAVGSLVYG